MSLAHGQAVVLGLALVMSVWEFADQFGLLGVVGVLVGDVPIVVRGTVGAALALAGGLVGLVHEDDHLPQRVQDGEDLLEVALGRADPAVAEVLELHHRHASLAGETFDQKGLAGADRAAKQVTHRHRPQIVRLP